MGQYHGLQQTMCPVFEIKLAGKEVSIEVEVTDAPLDYNFLLGRSWTYAMSAIASVVF